MAQSDFLVEAKNLKKKFGSQTVFDDLSFTIKPKEFVTLLGPSGCGKSTVLRLISGLELPTQGMLNISSDVANHLSMVFQDANLLGWKTALENVCLPFQIKNQFSQVALKKSKMWLEQLGLGKSLKKFPFELSGGMKMRVSIARSLALGPQLLLMDEPFAALDENTRFSLQENVRELYQNSEQLSVVFVTHSISEAVFLSDRVLIFGMNGQIHHQEKIELPAERISDLRSQNIYFEQQKKISRLFSEATA